MFKLLKSKRGFTLVELMIVVVIMAILVAVAVPIYSAVTSNARKKACITNMRELTTQITNYAMSKGTNLGTNSSTDTVINITYTSGANYGQWGSKPSNMSDADWNDLTKSFSTVPYCSSVNGGGYTITIYLGTGDEAGSVIVDIECDNNTADSSLGHTYG